MKFFVLPKSHLGSWVAWSNIVILVVGILFYIFAELNRIITSDALIAIVGTVLILIALVNIVAGLITVIKHKERSILVFGAILVGLVALTFIIINIIYGE